MDFDYKKYSLENLENWLHDAISSAEATPQEIYDVIKNVVEEQYLHHKQNGERCSELLSLLTGGEYNNKYQNHLDKIFSCDKDDSSPECQKSWNDFWEDVDETHSREYNLREAEYYNKRAHLDADSEKIKALGGYEWTPDPIVSRNDPDRIKYDGVWIYESPDKGKTVTKRKPGSSEKITIKKDRVVKWQLPVQQVIEEGIDNYFVQFPDDLLEAVNLKEGDTVEWTDQGDGSYLLKKV